LSIVTVGSVALDSVKTPERSVENALGGSAVYFSVAASYFTKVKLVAVAGSDFPQEHIELLKSKNIDLEGLEIKSDGNTFRWKGEYGENLNEAITLETHLNVFEEFVPSIPESYSDCNCLFLGNIDPELQLRVLEKTGNGKFIALDTMNFWITGKNDMLKKVIGKINALLINDTESKMLSGKNNITDAAESIINMGPQYVVIKRGEYGALLFSKDKQFFVPAVPLKKVSDPTGAGDSFAGGFVGYIASKDKIDNKTLNEAVVAGTVMASFAVQDFSIEKTANLNKEEIKKQFHTLKDLTHFEVPDKFK